MSRFRLLPLALASVCACFSLPPAAQAEEAGMQNYAPRLEELRQLVKLGDPDAEYELAGMYAEGQGVAKDPATAVSWWQQAAAQDHARSQWKLGQSYMSGIGIGHDDYAQAASYLRHSAEQGYLPAQLALADLLVGPDHDGLRHDDREAAHWYLLAARQGDRNAQQKLGDCYALGHGMPQDINRAVVWWLQAARQRNVAAEYNLARSYLDGAGVWPNPELAAKWLQRAAAAGDGKAQLLLGDLYHEGRGVAQDFSQAALWYGKAAVRGDDIAQVRLATLYERGEGRRQNLIIACAWYEVALGEAADPQGAAMTSLLAGDASDAEWQQYKDRLSAARAGYQEQHDRLLALLTAAEQAEVRAMASGWQPGHLIAQASR